MQSIIIYKVYMPPILPQGNFLVVLRSPYRQSSLTVPTICLELNILQTVATTRVLKSLPSGEVAVTIPNNMSGATYDDTYLQLTALSFVGLGLHRVHD